MTGFFRTSSRHSNLAIRSGTAYLLLVLAISACQLGPRIDKFEHAREPEGITTTIELSRGFSEGGRLEGELLEVQEHGLLLNVRELQESGVVKRRLVFVPFIAMEDIDLHQLGIKVLADYDGDTEEDVTSRRVYQRERLRLLSRFPQGLSTPLLEQLLAAEGQSAVDVISRR